MKASWKEVIFSGGCVLLIALVYVTDPFHTLSWDPLLRVYGFVPFRLPSRSMEPTIPEDSIFLVSVWAYVRSEPRAGDIVVFRYPRDSSVTLVKRIIASGGSTVEISDGVVLVDGQPLPQEYIDRNAATSSYSTSMRRIRVPPKSYFVMGDNRDASSDSRVWGFVPRDHVIGKLETILFKTN